MPVPTAAPPLVPTAMEPAGVLVNDLHSGLNPTRVGRIVRPAHAGELPAMVRAAREQGLAVTPAGGWHAMGGQQFAEGALLLDTRDMVGVVAFDAERGLVEVEAGIQWPALVAWLHARQAGAARPWSIRQKQSGADRLSLGGAVSANAHGRGLTMRPIVDDVEALTVVGADGVARRCSRTEHPELFALVVGGYGLLGAIATVTLRLSPRVPVQRHVAELTSDALLPALQARIAAGHRYGDFQFAIDPASDDFLHRGILSTYAPCAERPPAGADTHHALSPEDWRALLHLAHTDRAEAYRRYRAHYLRTDGQRYWSDTHQLATYLDGYHAELDRRTGAAVPGSEMITELYVPRHRLAEFLVGARAALRAHGGEVVYGTIRLIEQDDETVLAWAREPWACTILNLHVDHAPDALARAADAFRALIDVVVPLGGSYFLTYHRWATRAQLLACHPRLPEFLRAKRRHDPHELFQSSWYRHHVAMLADLLATP